jgi:hypothetical protein
LYLVKGFDHLKKPKQKMQSKEQFLNLVNSPFKFRLYLFFNLPAAFFSGVRIKNCSEEKCVTVIPYKWLTKNPFRSAYFASLSMAAEMSTGALALSNIYKRTPPISMLVVKMEATYFKKATGITIFSCEDGLKIREAVNHAASGGESESVTVKSIGKDENGALIAEFLFTWSFKSKPKR